MRFYGSFKIWFQQMPVRKKGKHGKSIFSNLLRTHECCCNGTEHSREAKIGSGCTRYPIPATYYKASFSINTMAFCQSLNDHSRG